MPEAGPSVSGQLLAPNSDPQSGDHESPSGSCCSFYPLRLSATPQGRKQPAPVPPMACSKKKNRRSERRRKRRFGLCSFFLCFLLSSFFVLSVLVSSFFVNSVLNISARLPPMDEPPMDEPPMDEPPMDEPPMDEPPMDEPSMDEPSMENRSMVGLPTDNRAAV